MKRLMKRALSGVTVCVLLLSLIFPMYSLAADEKSTLDKLKDLLSYAHTMKEEEYTTESWEALVEVRDSIEEPEEIPEQYQQAVLDGLQDAIDGLVKKETTLDKLIALLEKAKLLKEKDYTPESWLDFAEIRDSIEEPEELPEQYQQAVLDGLQDAMDGLVKAKNQNGFHLEDGIYAVTFTPYLDREMQQTGPMYFKAYGRQAYVKVENGKYQVTFRKSDNSKDGVYQVLKPEYFQNTEILFGQKGGTKNWIPNFDYANTSIHPDVVKGFVEENNKYWLDTSYQIENGYTDFTVELEDLSKDIFVWTGSKTGSESAYIDFDEMTAQKISAEQYQSVGNVFYSPIVLGTLTSETTLIPSNFFAGEGLWNVADKSAVLTASFQESYQNYFSKVRFYEWTYSGTEIPVQDNGLALSYDLSSEKDIALGKTICSPYNKDGFSPSIVTIYPRLTKGESITLTEEKTGAQVITSTDILPKTTTLAADEVEQGSTAYELFHSSLDSIKKEMYLYHWSYDVGTGNKTVNTSGKVTMKFKIPEGWNKEKIQLAYWAGEGGGGLDPKGNSVKFIGIEDGYYVIQTSRIGYFSLYEVKDISGTGENLENGTYTIPVSIYHLTNPGQTSMADKCVGEEATVVVKDGVKTLYMDFGSVEQYGMKSYMTKVWLYGSDMTMKGSKPQGSINLFTFTSYYRNEQGGFLTDGYNENTLNYYPKSGYAELVSDKAQWPARFKVPVMDDIGGGNFEQDAWLTLDWANVHKVSDTPMEAPIKNALGESIAIAETAVKEEYTGDTWEKLRTAYESAREVYEGNGDNGEAMKAANTSLVAAINQLESPEKVVLAPGLYTAKSKIDGDIVTGARVLVKEKEEDATAIGADVYLQVQGIQSLEYYDITQKGYVSAELEGDSGVTGARFTLSDMSSIIVLKYQDQEGVKQQKSLSLSDFEAQNVDKGLLKERLEKAQQLIEEAAQNGEKYDAEKLAVLQTAAAKGTEIYQNWFTLQDETDALAASIQEAISSLTLSDNLEKLKQAVEEAGNKNGELYTPVSYQALETELNASRALLEKGDVSGSEVEAQVLKLNAVLQGLVERADKSKLKELYDTAVVISDQGYAGWNDLQEALKQVKIVLDDLNSSQNEVDVQLQSLQSALDQLSGGIDKSALSELIAQAENLDLSAYSEESSALFQAALTSAREILQKAGASQQQVDRQIQLVEKVSAALIEKTDPQRLYNGTYSMNAVLRHAAADQDSMGNAALKKPVQIVVNGDAVSLNMEYVPLTTKLGNLNFTGYLAEFSYFPDWEGGESGYDAPDEETPIAANVETYYENVWDSYNHPDSGTDDTVRGKSYPHFMTIPVVPGDGEIWVQVYVPVMESINQGSGRQYAKLHLDWDSRTQISGTETQKSTLQNKIAGANDLLNGLRADAKGYSESQINMLNMAIVAAQAVNSNLNVEQAGVDATLEALQRALDVFSKEEVVADKTELKKAIEKADSYMNNVDVSYTDTTRAILERAFNNAQKIYDNPSATQTQVNLCVSAINQAIDGLVVDGADKTELKKALNIVKTYLEAANDYSAAALETLRSLYDTANAVYKDSRYQDEVDAQIRILNYAVENLKKVEEASVDRTGLHAMLLTASAMTGRENIYTSGTIQTLKKAMEKAEEVYGNKKVTQEQVNLQVSELMKAISNLKLKNTGQDNSTDNGSGNNGSSGGNNNSGSGENALNVHQLEDGVYAVNGSMVKIDKASASMANEAINHTIKLTVKDGHYYITLDFQGLSINSFFGYLSELKYFASGYTLDRYGAPQGELKGVNVDSYQKDSGDALISDNFGTNYPNQVTFELISEALDNGYVPLQVFVPIMESISAGSGTQPVYLKLNWSTLKKADADSPEFSDNQNNTSGGEGGSSGSGISNSPLKSSGSGSAPSVLKSTGTSSLSGSKSSLSTGSGLKGNTKSKLKGAGISEGTTLKDSSSGVTSSWQAESVNGDVKEGSAAAVPIAMSIISVLAGIVYKLRSRR